MWVRQQDLPPVQCAWCARIAASVGETLPDRFDTHRMHYIVYWKNVEAQRAPFERAYATKFVAIFKSVRKLAEDVYRSTNSVTSVTHAIQQLMPSQLRAVEAALYRDVAQAFASRALAQLLPKSFKATAGEYDPFTDPAMRAWFNSFIGARVTRLANFTAKDINRLIHAAIDAGNSMQDTIAELEDAYSLSNVRATTIARTETVSAGNAGNYFSVLANIGTNLNKVWLSTQDDRTRDSHIEANKQKQEIEDPFIVGGSQLLFPGDPSLGATARQLINCRCTLYFERIRRAA